MRKVMPPPQPEVRMRSVGSVTGCESVTSARPSTSEISSRRDLGGILHDLLHPEIADHQRVELEGGAEQREKALAVDVDRQRLLPDDLALDFFEPAALDVEVGPHVWWLPASV